MATAPHAPGNYIAVRPDWLARRSEPALAPELPIVDPHHHLWDRPPALLRQMPPLEHGFMDILRSIPRYLLDEYLVDLRSGHNVRATVFIECRAMYRADAPDPYKSVGETEFVNGIAAMSASGGYGTTRVAAGIVGLVDLTLGARAEEVLRAHMAAASEITSTTVPGIVPFGSRPICTVWAHLPSG